MSSISGELTVIQAVHLVVAEVRWKLSVSKQAVKKFDMERFNLKELNDVEVKEHYQVKISNKFAA
jgi:hypothetical protein